MPQGKEMALVFVHLGSHKAPWLVTNMRQTKSNFPNRRVLLVSDNERLIKKCAKLNIESIFYEPSVSDFELENNSDWDLQFRSGFWLQTTRRFLALTSAQECLDSPVLHIESDVLLSPRIDLLAFSRLNQDISFGLVAPGIGVGALVYLRKPESSRFLSSFVLEEFKMPAKTNDMKILGAFARRYPEMVALLPTSPSQESLLFKQDTDIEFRRAVSALRYHFGGIFDVATIGQYMGGTDPRNERGIRRVYFVSESHRIDPSLGAFSCEKGGLLSVEDESPGSKVEVLSLHIHSKDLRFFYDRSATRLIEKRITESRGRVVREFSLWGFFEALRSALRHLI